MFSCSVKLVVDIFKHTLQERSYRNLSCLVAASIKQCSNLMLNASDYYLFLFGLGRGYLFFLDWFSVFNFLVKTIGHVYTIYIRTIFPRLCWRSHNVSATRSSCLSQVYIDLVREREPSSSSAHVRYIHSQEYTPGKNMNPALLSTSLRLISKMCILRL